ncbi:unnamed protein product [Brugia pahangi]|uniref:Uncharacterized protein n=1 Tax=Brugia pahangi TaxID=6280 RepID=A0A0N4T8Z7_BRUPA|nr:unnamed protein product [Brugia pahangi]
MILFIILGLLLLAALLGTMIWFLRKITKQNKPSDKVKKTKTINYQPVALGYRSYKQNESQEGLGTENLIRKEKDDLYSTPNDNGTLRSMRGRHGYRNPLYTTTTSTVKIRETFDRTIDDANKSYDKSGTGTDTGIGTGGEITGRSEITVNNDNRKQLNTAGIRRNEYQIAEPIPLPNTNSGQFSGNSSGHYSTRETFEERCEENYIAEEEKPLPYADTKELL